MNEINEQTTTKVKYPVYIELGYGKVCAAKMGILVPSKKRAGDVEEPVRKRS